MVLASPLRAAPRGMPNFDPAKPLESLEESVIPTPTTRSKASKACMLSSSQREDRKRGLQLVTVSVLMSSRPNRRNAPQRSVAAHVREQQRRVAEREASRLARPAAAPTRTLGHASRSKSAVTSTPFGILPTKASDVNARSNEWCGPLAVARQMIAAREQARREREEEQETAAAGGEGSHPLDQAMKELEEDGKRKEHPSLQWKPDTSAANGAAKNAAAASSWYAKRQRTAVRREAIPTLLDLSLAFLVDNFEYVESLGEIGPDLRRQMAAALVARQKLDGPALAALQHVGMDSLELVDASGVTGEELTTTIQALLPAGLRYLHLDQCGRCFGKKAVQALLADASRLVALSIGGAYLFTDEDAAQLLAQSDNLSSVDLKASPLVGLKMCQALSERSFPLVELALEDIKLTDESWQALCQSKSSLSRLERLKLCRVEGVTDDIVGQLLALTTSDGQSTLQAIDLSHNYTLTDVVLEPIRLYTSRSLRSLTLTGLGQLSAEALEALFTHIPDLAPPPRLVVLDLSHLDHQAVTDSVLAVALVAAAGARSDEKKSASGGGGIARLNVKGAKLLTDASLESLVTFGRHSLEELNVSYCTSLTDQGMGYLVDQCAAQLREIELWGLAQLTDAFLEGNRRTNDPTLAITGVWMKKSASRTIQ